MKRAAPIHTSGRRRAQSSAVQGQLQVRPPLRNAKTNSASGLKDPHFFLRPAQRGSVLHHNAALLPDFNSLLGFL